MEVVASPVSKPVQVRIAQGFVLCAWLYTAGIVAQFFAIGMVVLAGHGTWLLYHIEIGHYIGLFVVLAPILAWLARLPRFLILASVGLFILHGLQYFFAGAESGSMLRALHAVNALAIFVTVSYLGRRGLEILRQPR
jgi:hypothetical protein